MAGDEDRRLKGAGESASILWRRLAPPGHDACRLLRTRHGWRLEGHAAFLHRGVAVGLAYRVDCDGRWHTRAGVVSGWMGPDPIALRAMHRRDGAWLLNGAPAPEAAGCIDLDLGFTPATNLIALRRAALPVGAAATLSAAHLDLGTPGLTVLPQRYERRSARGYWYEAPLFRYAALLQVDPDGFIEEYPGLWASVPRGIT